MLHDSDLLRIILNNSSTIDAPGRKATLCTDSLAGLCPSRPRGGFFRMTRGLFLCGTDTDVGKTAVAESILRELVRGGVAVGVCKPVASGVTADGGDPYRLWLAAGQPGTLADVCPQSFAAPLAPARAAAAEGRCIDEALLVSAVEAWRGRSGCVVVEGAGGLYSPLSPRMLNADLARTLGFPLVVCDDARLGAIGRTLAVVTAARSQGHQVAAVVLSEVSDPGSADADDPQSPAAIALSAVEDLAERLAPLPVAFLRHGAERIEPALDWMGLAGCGLM
jgi:dethiobiotin synthetase